MTHEQQAFWRARAAASAAFLGICTSRNIELVKCAWDAYLATEAALRFKLWEDSAHA